MTEAHRSIICEHLRESFFLNEILVFGWKELERATVDAEHKSRKIGQTKSGRQKLKPKDLKRFAAA